MKRRVVTPLLALLVAAACAGPRTPAPTRTAVTIPDTIRVRSGSRIVSVPFEEYVLGSALSEVAPLNERDDTVARIFAVQAVLARTYALAHLGKHRDEGFDLCDTTHCQLYEPDRLRTSRFAAAARRAVADTRHVVLLYNDRPADAVYHADCGGHTASADAVWGGPAVDYLVGAKDDVSPATHRPWQFITPSTALRNALDADPRTNTGGRLDALTITRVDDSGRVEAIEIRGRRATTVRGEAFRSIVSRAFGERSLLSTKFSLERQGRDYRFDGSGFGHGVGLCQVGAAARARRGTVPEMIFAAYFPGTRLAELREGRPATIHTPAPFPGLIRSP